MYIDLKGEERSDNTNSAAAAAATASGLTWTGRQGHRRSESFCEENDENSFLRPVW